RFVPSAAEDASLSEEERRRGLEFSTSLSVRVLSRAWQMLLKGIGEVQASNRPLAAGEMVLIRMAHAATLPTLDEALKKFDDATPGAPGDGPMARGPRPSGDGGGVQPVAQMRSTSNGGGSPAMRLVERQEVAEPVAVQPQPVPEPQTGPVVRSLADIASLADANRDLAFKVQLKRSVRPVRIEPGRIEVALTEDAPKTLLGDLTNRLQKWTGRRWIVSLSREKGGATMAEEEAGRRQTAMSDARADPAVAAILEHFPGARIIDVRIPDAAETEIPVPDPGVEPETDEDDDTI